MRGGRVLLVLGGLLGAVSQAQASVVTLFDGVLHADSGAGFPLGISPGLAGPGGYGGGTIEGDTLVTAPFGGTLTISVQDLSTPGNVFEIVLDGTSLGTTAAVAAGGAVNSSGVFSAAVAAGDHDVGLWDFILTYLGGVSPDGGTVGNAFASPQPVQLTITEVPTTVPEPGSATLLLPAVAGLAWAVRRRARLHPTL